MSRENNEEKMNAIQRERHERRMAVRRKSMFTNIIVGGVILAVVAAIIVVAVTMLNNKPKTADTDPSAATSATTASSAAAATTATQAATQSSNAAAQQNQQSNQAQQQYSTDVQLPAQSGGQTDSQTSEQATERSDGSVQEIGGERVYVDSKHTAPEVTGSSGHWYGYGASPEGGFNWNYDADNGNFVVSCNYNFDQQMYDFSFYGASPGTANVTLYYYDTSGQWSPVNLTVHVDDSLNVTVG